MEFRESSINWLERDFHAKAQRRTQSREEELDSLCAFAQSLRLCVKVLFCSRLLDLRLHRARVG
jgi:hypothetical protein